MIYISQKDDDFPPEDNPTAELEGNDNIVSFAKFDISIEPGKEYQWRVDCVQESKRRTGDVWYFTMS